MTIGWTIRAAAAATALVATPLRADVLVISSSAPDLKPGMQLADTQQIDIPAGASVRVMLPSGATLQIKGATTRAVKEITKGEPIVEAVWSKAKELFATGGVDQSRVGATRSFRPPPKASPFTWNLVAAGASGTLCIRKGEPVMLERPVGVGELTVTDTGSGSQAKVAFPGDAKQASWPSDLQATHDHLFRLASATGMRQIRLRLIDHSNSTEDSALRTLIANDCLTQAKAWAKE